MTRLTTEAVVDNRTVAEVMRARGGVVAEKASSDNPIAETQPWTRSWTQADGPMASYRRCVTVEPIDDHRARVRQDVEFRLELPFWLWLFVLPLRRRLGRLVEPASMPWWLPPDRLDAQAVRTLAVLAAISLPLGYLGTLLTQTITFAGREFHAGSGAQGVTLAAARLDVLGAVVLIALADRQGRRRLLLLTLAVGTVLTATGGAAPGLAWLAATQVCGRAFVTAATALVAIMAVEEMPAGGRAYAISLLAMSSALGAGVCVMLLFLADLSRWGWRLLYVVPVLALLAGRPVARGLAESRRFGRPHRPTSLGEHGGRFRLLALAGLLFYLFVIPASEFQNQFLRTERHFSAVRISLFTLLTSTPGGLGIIVGGRLADVRGRRVVAATALSVGSAATALEYLSHGWPLWAWSVIGSIVGAAVVPSLGVYGPELFPTSLRGTSNGLLNVVNRAGSVLGLLAVAALAGPLGGIGPPLALLALGPVLLALVVLARFPETAHMELERLNPEDA